MTARRIIIALGIGLASAFCCWFLLNRFSMGAGDFSWAYTAATDLLNGRDPYARPFSTDWIPYPLPAALIAIPFTVFSPTIAAAVFLGLSSALMAYGLSKDGCVRLLAFLSCPFWVAVLWAQWSPLIVASAFFPVLMFAAAVKPHIAAPVAISYWSKIGVASALALFAISIAVYPTWPWKWVGQLTEFQRYIPMLTIPGPLLLLALPRWRERDACLLLLAALFPQRWLYDALILWLIPKTRKEFLFTAAASWIAYIWRIYHMPTSTIELGAMCVLCFYLPMLVVVLRRPRLRECDPIFRRKANAQRVTVSAGNV